MTPGNDHLNRIQAAQRTPFDRSHGRATTVLVLALVMSGLSACTPTPVAPVPSTVAYTSFQGTSLSLTGYVGEHIALLVPSTRTWDATVMWKIVDRLDAAHSYYAEITGREPDPASNFQGRSTVAVVPATCGAGCGYLGAQGIEVLQDHWQILYDGVAQRNEYDQVLFYELGRNFWFLGNKLSYVTPDDGGSVTTGFAVLNRFTSMDAAAVVGGPFGTTPFPTFRSNVHALVDSYEADAALNWANTLKVGTGSPGSGLGSTDLFASFIMRLTDYFGPAVNDRIWIEAATLPNATTTRAAVDNLMLAASAAVDRNLSALFATIWRFPISSQAAATAEARWGAPWTRP